MPASTLNSKLSIAGVVRTSDTNAYAAGDVINTATSGAVAHIAFTDAGLSEGGTGMIVGAFMADSNNPATKPNIDLLLFSALPAVIQDNAAFAPTDAEAKTYIGKIAFDGTSNLVGMNVGSNGTGNSVQEGVLPSGNLIFNCAAGSKTIYGVPVIRASYTPISAEEFTFGLRILQDH